MASKNSSVYLGFLDEQVNLKNKKHLSFSVSKIGGQPYWCTMGCENPSCAKCNRKMALILQIYAPLEGSSYHRTLYIFACITPTCWNRSQSWICLRSQVLEAKKTSTIETSKNTTDDVWMEDDDWDYFDDELDNGNGNISASSQMVLDYMASKRNPRIEKENNSSVKANLNERTVKSNENTIGDVTKCLEDQLNLNEGYSNANEQIGAVGVMGNVCGGMEASALIEGPEGDMVAVETPEKPSTDLVALFKEVPNYIDIKVEVSFVPYFIAVSLEPPEDTRFTEHERELLLRYTQSTGHNITKEDCFEAAGGKMADDFYEKNTVCHGDSLLHKFKKRISRSPYQILRYCREESSKALWMRSPNFSNIRKTCASCGGRLIFEAQIMPQLVSSLEIQDLPNPVLEFGTVVVYTCLSSCWAEGSTAKPEVCVVQFEEP